MTVIFKLLVHMEIRSPLKLLTLYLAQSYKTASDSSRKLVGGQMTTEEVDYFLAFLNQEMKIE